MKEKHQKMKLNASGHQSENERQLKKFNYSEQKHIALQHFLHNSCFEDVLVEKYAVLNMFNRQDSFAFLVLLTNCLK